MVVRNNKEGCTMSQAQAQRLQRTIGVLRIAILALIVITALVHLQRGIGMSMGGFNGPPPRAGGIRPGGPPGGGFNILRYLPLPLSYLFLLNGIGYLTLGVALYLPALARFRHVVRWLLIIFATVTFFMYFLVNGFRLNPTALIDKLAELTLIALLLIDQRRSSRRAVVAAVPT
jgi:hypothetical protein